MQPSRFDLKSSLVAAALCVLAFCLGIFAHHHWSAAHAPTAAPDLSCASNSLQTTPSTDAPAPLLTARSGVRERLSSRHTRTRASPPAPPSTTPDAFVKLNVGGVQYLTTLVTLLRFNDSKLYQLIDDAHRTSPLREEYSLNRDGLAFRHILNFLRDGERMPMNPFWSVVAGGNVYPGITPDTNPKYRKTELHHAVMVEAQYFELHALVALLNDPILTCRLCHQSMRLSDATPYSIGPRVTQWSYESVAYAVRSSCPIAQVALNAENGGRPTFPQSLALHDLTDAYG